MWWCFMIALASEIRTRTGERLLRKISLVKMHYSLIDLFVDRTDIDTSLRRLFDKDGIDKAMQFSNCQYLNDERTINFHQGLKQDGDVFLESKQIWIPSSVDPIKDDLFIPRDDAQ